MKLRKGRRHHSNKCSYRPQMKFAKVMFLQVCVCPQGRTCVAGDGACMVGGMHGGGHAWQVGGMHGRGHAWWGACMVGACMAGGMCDRGWRHAWWEHAWQGACMASGGHAWGACVTGGMHGTHASPPHWQIIWLRHTGNERVVRIPLQCILVIGDSLRKPLEIEQTDFDVVGWTRRSCVLPLESKFGL